ncbi:MAG: RHS repeat-associated core domain-containing protein [Deltaproteobacteria bacterium]|nr:RHS repeat-associated core domain-containing protein [Deltaproteobacteria bacterium]
MIRWSFIFALWCSVVQAEVRYFHSDHLGSTAVGTNAVGTVQQTELYTPFGEIVTPHPFPSPQRGEGLGEGAISYLYTGQELDHEIDLYDYGARRYDPAVARFVSVDPVAGKPAQPQSFNAYAYVWNNPIRLVDPEGRNPADPIAPYARLRTEAVRIAREVESPGRMEELREVLRQLDDMRVDIVMKNPELAERIESGRDLQRSLNRSLPEGRRFSLRAPDRVSIARSLRGIDSAVETAGRAGVPTTQSANGTLRLLRGPARLLGGTAVVALTTYDVYQIGDEVYAGNYEEAGEYAAKLGIVGGSTLAFGPLGGAGAALILWVVEMTQEEATPEEACPMAHLQSLERPAKPSPETEAY